MQNKVSAKRLVSLMTAVALVLAMFVMPSFAAGTASASFSNTSGDGGSDAVSMTALRTFKAMIPVNMTADEASAAISAEDFAWTVSRDTPFLDETLYPNYYKGGKLSEFPSGVKDVPFFKDIKSAVETVDGTVYVTVTFSNVGFFGDDLSVKHGNGAFMDYIGDFALSAGSLGSVTININAYDSFHTMSQIYESMMALSVYDTDLYVKKGSLGKSEAGLDMPYLIIAKDKSDVDAWLELTERAESDPDSVLADIESGKLNNVKVPVMFSNVHANETSAADSIIKFAWMLVKNDKIDMNVLDGFTAAGEEELAAQMGATGEAGSLAVPDLVADSASYLGYIKGKDADGNTLDVSGEVDLDTYYETSSEKVKVSDLLDDVFFLLVPEENVEGRTNMTRTSSGGFDLNRDNSFQTQAETQNMTAFIAKWNPVSYTELHGRVEQFQCEPCDPPHEPNFEYDLLAEHLMTGGEAFGKAAAANNDSYNSYVIPQRDYLEYTGETNEDGSYQTYWSDPWDDMSTSYTPQYAMLHGTVSYTVECPAYNDECTTGLSYGELGQAVYVADSKLDYLENQVSIFKRGVDNANSNDYDLVGQWFCDQYDVEGAEMDVFRPTYSKAGQNGNFYPECYIIPVDGDNQSNLQAASDMIEYLIRNDVTVMKASEAFTYKGVEYPAGTAVVSMYQAKRSVANGVLYKGTVITDWTVLYSEGITAFNYTRGFDMKVCAEPAQYSTIAAVCAASSDWNVASSFSGTADASVVIGNDSEDSTAAVNELLLAGKSVGMTDSGDYVVSYADWQSVASDYVITGTGVETAPAAKTISKAPVVYISGVPADDSTGFIYKTRYSSSYEYNYDRQAMELMGFTVTDDASEADVIVGAAALDEAGLAAVKAGTPYIGYGRRAIPSITGSVDKEGNEVDGALFAYGSLVRETVGGSSMDALTYVTYPTENMTNASYIADGDKVLYGYGAAFFSAIPDGAEVLVQIDGTKKPLEGFLVGTGKNYDKFFANSVQGISYVGADKDGNQIDVTLFANTLTNKVHQRDEYAFISNTIFASLLAD